MENKIDIEEYKIKKEMMTFKFWCNAFNGGKGKKDLHIFAKYLWEVYSQPKTCGQFSMELDLERLVKENFNTDIKELYKIDVANEPLLMDDNDIITKREKELQAQASEQYNRMKTNGDFIYNDFVVWIKRYHNNKGKHDGDKFKEYLKEEDIALTEKQRYYLAEKYFGYKGEKDGKREKDNKRR